jgi:predicted membrane protein
MLKLQLSGFKVWLYIIIGLAILAIVGYLLFQILLFFLPLIIIVIIYYLLKKPILRFWNKIFKKTKTENYTKPRKEKQQTKNNNGDKIVNLDKNKVVDVKYKVNN